MEDVDVFERLFVWNTSLKFMFIYLITSLEQTKKSHQHIYFSKSWMYRFKTWSPWCVYCTRCESFIWSDNKQIYSFDLAFDFCPTNQTPWIQARTHPQPMYSSEIKFALDLTLTKICNDIFRYVFKLCENLICKISSEAEQITTETKFCIMLVSTCKF